MRYRCFQSTSVTGMFSDNVLRHYTDLPFEGEIPHELDGMVMLTLASYCQCFTLLSMFHTCLRAILQAHSSSVAVHAQWRQYAI